MNSEAIRGAIGMACLAVRPADTSVAQALNDLPILATPTLVNILESACSAALAEHLGNSETTVTIELNVITNSAVGVGSEIRAHATCIDITEGVFKFNVEVHFGSKLIALGVVKRKLVDRLSFSARVTAESMISDTSPN